MLEIVVHEFDLLIFNSSCALAHRLAHSFRRRATYAEPSFHFRYLT
jgi:hypothetical protein